jgi:hypothetical protein
VIREFNCRDRSRRNGGFGTHMGGYINSIRQRRHIVTEIGLNFVMRGRRHIIIITCMYGGYLGNRECSRAYNIRPLYNFTLNIEYSFTRLGLGGKKGLCVHRGSKGRYKRCVGGDGFGIYVA